MTQSPYALETDRVFILEEATLRPEKEVLWKDAINISLATLHYPSAGQLLMSPCCHLALCSQKLCQRDKFGYRQALWPYLPQEWNGNAWVGGQGRNFRAVTNNTVWTWPQYYVERFMSSRILRGVDRSVFTEVSKYRTALMYKVMQSKKTGSGNTYQSTWGNFPEEVNPPSPLQDPRI